MLVRLDGGSSSANIARGTLNLSSKPQQNVARGGTRIPCEIPVTLTSPNPCAPFSQPCCVILANLRGCAVRSPAPLPVGTAVNLEGLPSQAAVQAKVVHCISLGEFEKLWLVGLALNESNNVWGIDPVPEDWRG
jgi:hypothetical protein